MTKPAPKLIVVVTAVSLAAAIARAPRADDPPYPHGEFIDDCMSTLIPFELKLRAQDTGRRELQGVIDFCRERNVSRGYVIRKDVRDFGIVDVEGRAGTTRLLKVPAPLACYWLGLAELTPEVE